VATTVSEHTSCGFPRPEHFHVLRRLQDNVACSHSGPRSKANRHAWQRLCDQAWSAQLPRITCEARAVTSVRTEVRADALTILALRSCRCSRDNGATINASGCSRFRSVNESVRWLLTHFLLPDAVPLLLALPLGIQFGVVLSRLEAGDAHRHSSALMAAASFELESKHLVGTLGIREFNILDKRSIIAASDRAKVVLALFAKALTDRASFGVVHTCASVVIVVNELNGGVLCSHRAKSCKKSEEAHLQI